MSESTTPKPSAAAKPAGAPRQRKMPPIEQLRGRQLGRVLIKMGLLRRGQVEEALEIQKERRGPIGAILVELVYITNADLSIALAAQSGMSMIELATLDIADEVIKMMSSQMAMTYRVVP